MIVCSLLFLFRFYDLVLLGMHDKLAEFEITGVLFTFSASVLSEGFDIKMVGLMRALVTG